MHYLVTAVLKLPAGSLVGLSDAQAKRRAHAVKAVPKRKGWYEATAELHFKCNEAIQYEGELPKSLAGAVESPKREGKAAGGSKQPPAGSGKAAGAGTSTDDGDAGGEGDDAP